MTPAQIKQQALELDPDKRLRLVQDIWDSLITEPALIQLPKHHKHLIDQRVAEHDAHPGSAISLGQAKRQIRKHLAKRSAK